MYKVDAGTFLRTALQHCWWHSHFSMYCTLHLCQKSFSTLKQEHVFPASEIHSSFSPAAGTWHFSVSHHLVVVSLIFQKTNQVQMWLWGQHCRVGAVTMSVQIFLWCHWWTRVCRGEATLLIFFLWDWLDKGKHSDFSVLQWSSDSLLFSLGKNFTKITTLSWKAVAMFIADSGALFEFVLLLGCCVVPFHWLSFQFRL